MKKAILISFLLSILSGHLSAQEEQSDQMIAQLDSLLLHNQIDQFQLVYNASIQQVTADEQKILINYYETLLDRLTILKNGDNKKSFEDVRSYKDHPEYFFAEEAGAKSNSAYQNYIHYIEIEDTAGALVQLNLALFFRSSFFRLQKTESLNLFNQANYYYTAGNADSARLYLEQYQNKVQRYNFLKLLKDNMNFRVLDLEKNIKDMYREEHEQKKHNLSERFSLSYSLLLNSSLPINHKYWTIKLIDGTNELIFKRKAVNLKSDITLGHGLIVNYYFRPDLSTTLGFTYHYLKYPVPSNKPGYTLKEKYQVDFFNSTIMINYYLNRRIGFKPVLGLGCGYAQFKMKINDKYIYYDYFESGDEVKLANKAAQSFLVAVRVGTDYLFDSPSFNLGAAITYAYLFNNLYYINQHLLQFSVMTGYRF